MTKTLLLPPGGGIGPEVAGEVRRVVGWTRDLGDALTTRQMGDAVVVELAA